MTPKSLYIAGPMAGVEDLNYPLFYEVESILNGIEIETVNPAELDKLSGDHEEIGIEVTALQRARFLKRDFHHLTTCEGIVFLEGWHKSIGANCELLVAQVSGMSTWLWIDGSLYPEPNLNADLNLIFAHLNKVVWGVADLDG